MRDANNGLMNQYSQGYNTSDNLFSHSADPLDANWGINASNPYPQSSHAVYQNGDWSSQQHLNIAPQNHERHSPLATNNAYNGTNYHGYNAAYGYQQPQQQYDPSLLQSAQAFKQPQHQSYASQAMQSMTIAPQSLQQTMQQEPPAVFVDEAALLKAVPPSKPYNIFSMVDMNQLMKATNTQKLAPFATIAKTAVEYNISRAAVPQYVPRQSKNALKRMAGQDGALLAKINYRDAKKQRVAEKRAKAASRPMKSARDVAGASIGSPEDLSDDDSDSSDSDDESPLPTKRPDLPKDAIEYDTIQALWRSKRKSIDAADVRKGLVDFWELIKTVRDRWKADAGAVSEAREKKLKGEIPLLEQRVKDQRDMIEAAFKAARQYGNRTIVETLSENTPLLFLCYQFLLDRLKSEPHDCDGPLARAILEVMSSFNTLTDEKLEKTHLVKILPRYIKNGDARTQFWVKQILTKAKQNSEGAKKPSVKAEPSKTPAVKAPGETVVAKKPSAATTMTSTLKKRPLESDDTKPVTKKPATSNGISGKPITSNGTTIKSSMPAVKAADPAKPKAPTASKLTSGLFAGLQSAAKKPGTSVKTSAATTPAAKAVPPTVKPAVPAVKPAAGAAPATTGTSGFSFLKTMQDLAKPKEEQPKPKVVEKDVPNETPEEKARRLRREARGPLRVHWKSADELEQVRVFVHDPEEETGHDSSQTRDVGDLQGEGRMFKQQHSMMDLDDEEDEVEIKLVNWYQPEPIDFDDVPSSERERNYYPYGGGTTEPESAENIERKKYEDSTLMVFYSHSDDIPATPREPEEEIAGEEVELVKFGAVPDKYIERAKTRLPPKPIDFGALRNAFNMSGAAPPVQAPVVTPDINALLASLAQNKAPPPPMPAFNAGNAAFPNLFPPAAPPPPTINGAPNIAAIIAQLNGGAPPPMQAPVAAPLPFVVPPPGMMDAGFAAFLAAKGHAIPAVAPQSAPPVGAMYENPDRKRYRDGEDTEGRKENPNYKTKVCKYWQEGKCQKGDNCTYRHA